MRKISFFVILFVFVVVFSNPHLISGAKKPAPPSKTSSEGAEAYFSETTWNFGNIPPNSVVSHSFWIKNVGTDTLKILQVRPG